MNNKTIAIFQGYFLPHFGGVERYTYNLAKKLHERGYNILIVTTKHDTGLKEKEKLEFATVFRFNIYKTFSNRYPIIKKDKTYKKILNELKKASINYIILNTRFWLTTLIGAKFAKENNIPCCVIEHGTSHFTVYNKVLDFCGRKYEHWLTRKVKKYVNVFYGVSGACCQWLKHFKIEAKGVFYNAIGKEEYDLYKSETTNDDKIRVVFAGRLIRDKGILLLTEAFEGLREKYYNIELIIAGDGPLKDKIIKDDRIILTGRLEHDEIMRLCNKADIFVNPSYSEGMPTSLLEAGLMKCAIIATPVGGTVELIQDGVDGIFCDTTVDSIREKLEILIENKEFREKLKENIHTKICEEFTWDKTAGDVIQALKM